MDSNVVTRVAFAAIAIPVALGIVWLGGWPLVVLVSLVSALGVRELYELADRRSGGPADGLTAGPPDRPTAGTPARTYGTVTAALLAPLAYASVSQGWNNELVTRIIGLWPYLGALWIMGLLAWALARRAPADQPLRAVAVTLFAVLYAGALPTFIIAIRHGQHGLRSWPGTWLVFFPLAVIWICDTAAMFGGRAIGGPKLAPSVSPGKTRSGSLAGVVGGLATVPLFAWVFFRPLGMSLPWGMLFGIALAISVLGQVGDLAESLFKREVGVKDSSNLIPGHGGVLDRFDSLYFALPLTALGYRLFGII